MLALGEGRGGRRVGRALLGDQPPRVVHARPGDVRVDIHAPGHHDEAAGIEPRRAGGQVGDDAVALDAHIAHGSVHAVRRIVHRAAGDAEPGRRGHGASLSYRARTVSAAAARGPSPESAGRSGSGTSSIRNAVPPS